MGPEDRRVPLAFEEHDARIDAEAKVQERMPAPDAFCGKGVQKGVRRAGRAFRGAEGEQVENGSERRVIAHGEALQRAFSIDGPVLVDVVVAKEELAIPPQIKLEQAKGFSLYMLRAIISGRGDEVIELAKTNWLR
mgnify:FL=1